MDDGYNAKERAALEKAVQIQQERIIELGKSGKVPLKEAVNVAAVYQGVIDRKADYYGVPQHLAIGTATLENGGGTDSRSPCCRGIMQLSPTAAGAYGAIRREKRSGRNVWVDYRDVPEINIDAGVHYLSDIQKIHFADWGFTAQSYHAGPKRVKQAISIYLRAEKGRRIRWDQLTPGFIKEEDVTWIKMMQNPKAWQFFEGLKDETEFYLPKTLACWRIFLHRKKIFG